jgi:hypothetical protein
MVETLIFSQALCIALIFLTTLSCSALITCVLEQHKFFIELKSTLYPQKVRHFHFDYDIIAHLLVTSACKHYEPSR